MSARHILMVSAAILTLVAPAISSALLNGQPKLKRPLALLAGGLAVQMVCEFLLISLGMQNWISYFDAPIVALRLVQLGMLFRLQKDLRGRSRALFLALILSNFLLWITVEARLLDRIFW